MGFEPTPSNIRKPPWCETWRAPQKPTSANNKDDNRLRNSDASVRFRTYEPTLTEPLAVNLNRTDSRFLTGSGFGDEPS